MSLWTSSVISLLLLQTAQFQPLKANDDSKPVAIEEDGPHALVLEDKDWNVTQAYSDVFRILSDQNTCSSFYGGPRRATTVLNDFVRLVKTRALSREVSFQMRGRARFIFNSHSEVFYRLFDKTLVNINGSFYQRRANPMNIFPSNVGDFSPGTRQARALILLHELGHLIQGESGDWLIPDDGFNGSLSKANTQRVQQACRAQLESLK
ncbi:MAG TPA: hypothetical protein VJ875_26945 [Pyrinomonadaceae bacterium]|nr:hypothetical protein [Pyrinomonadaceae bacterium]